MSPCKESGFSLVSAIVGVGLVGMIAAGLATLFTRSSQMQNRVEKRAELLAVTQSLRDAVDCKATFANAGYNLASIGSGCSSTSTSQTSPWIQLYRTTRTGSAALTTAYSSSNGYHKIGNFTLRASCSAGEESLIIRAARPLPGGGFAKDPVSGAAMDWSWPQGLLTGGWSEGSVPLCQSVFVKPRRIVSAPCTLDSFYLTLTNIGTDVQTVNADIKSSGDLTLSTAAYQSGHASVTCTTSQRCTNTGFTTLAAGASLMMGVHVSWPGYPANQNNVNPFSGVRAEVTANEISGSVVGHLYCQQGGYLTSYNLNGGNPF